MKSTHEQDKEQQTLADLVARMALRDQQACKTFYTLTADRAYGMALKMMQEPARAQDVLQDVYIKAWSNAPQYRPHKGQVLSWLMTIVRNRSLDVIRAEQRRSQVMEEHQEQSQIMSFEQVKNTEGGLMLCLEKLSSPQRNNIIAAFYHGFTYQELAKKIGQPLATVKSRIRRSLLKLKECLEHEV